MLKTPSGKFITFRKPRKSPESLESIPLKSSRTLEALKQNQDAIRQSHKAFLAATDPAEKKKHAAARDSLLSKLTNEDHMVRFTESMICFNELMLESDERVRKIERALKASPNDPVLKSQLQQARERLGLPSKVGKRIHTVLQRLRNLRRMDPSLSPEREEHRRQLIRKSDDILHREQLKHDLLGGRQEEQPLKKRINTSSKAIKLDRALTKETRNLRRQGMHSPSMYSTEPTSRYATLRRLRDRAWDQQYDALRYKPLGTAHKAVVGPGSHADWLPAESPRFIRELSKRERAVERRRRATEEERKRNYCESDEELRNLERAFKSNPSHDNWSRLRSLKKRMGTEKQHRPGWRMLPPAELERRSNANKAREEKLKPDSTGGHFGTEELPRSPEEIRKEAILQKSYRKRYGLEARHAAMQHWKSAESKARSLEQGKMHRRESKLYSKLSRAAKLGKLSDIKNGRFTKDRILGLLHRLRQRGLDLTWPKTDIRGHRGYHRRAINRASQEPEEGPVQLRTEGDERVRELERAFRENPSDKAKGAELVRAKQRAGIYSSKTPMQTARGHLAKVKNLYRKQITHMSIRPENQEDRTKLRRRLVIDKHIAAANLGIKRMQDAHKDTDPRNLSQVKNAIAAFKEGRRLAKEGRKLLKQRHQDHDAIVNRIARSAEHMELGHDESGIRNKSIRNYPPGAELP